MAVIEPIRRTAHEKYLLWKEERKRRQWIRHYNRLREESFKGLERHTKIDDAIIYSDKAS